MESVAQACQPIASAAHPLAAALFCCLVYKTCRTSSLDDDDDDKEELMILAGAGLSYLLTTSGADHSDSPSIRCILTVGPYEPAVA